MPKFVDELTITITAGRGGNGVATFFPGYKTGPSGGDGGRGGDIYFSADPNMSDLYKYSGSKKLVALAGKNGANFNRDGYKGDDLTIFVPRGTSITDTQSGATIEINSDIPVLIAKGGKGGRGNTKFVSSTNRSPLQAETGRPGEAKTLRLVVRLIAEFGLIGLPNAGKSSLLNELTAASVRTAAYPFTTLEPNLGVFQRHIIADIPGLIEGASRGKGLGIKFLKHIEKVHTLLHCIPCDAQDIVHTYEVIRNELGSYNPSLLEKHEIILLTKTDLISESELAEKVQMLSVLKKEVLPLSLYNPEQMATLQKIILKSH